MSPQEHYLRTHLQPLILREYAGLLKPEHLVFQQTRKDFSGDITLVLFGPAKRLSMNPLAFGERTRIFLGTLSFEGQPLVESSEIVQGFLNISLSAHFWMHAHQEGVDLHPTYLEKSCWWSSLLPIPTSRCTLDISETFFWGWP